MTLIRISRVLTPRERQRAQIHPQRGELAEFFLQETPPGGNPWTLFTPGNRAPCVILCSETRLSAAWKAKQTPRDGEAHLCSGVSAQSSQFPSSCSVLYLTLGTRPTPDLCSVSPFTWKCWFLPPAPPVPPGKS